MRAGAIQARDEGAMPALINLHGSSMRAPMRAGAMKARDEGAMRAMGAPLAPSWRPRAAPRARARGRARARARARIPPRQG